MLAPAIEHDMANARFDIRFAHLFAIVAEELGRVHAVYHGAANEGQPVEDKRRIGRVPEEELLHDIDEDGERDKARDANGDLGANALLKVQLGQGMASGILDDAHRCELVALLARNRFD
jgi:hypothetical protein